MIVSIHQVGYFPWLGLLHKVACSELFVVLDSVQFNRRGFQHRALLRGPRGLHYLTAPVLAKGHRSHAWTIRDLRLDQNRPFQRKHFETLRHFYGRTPGWSAHAGFFEDLLLRRTWIWLYELNQATFEHTCRSFGVDTPSRWASELSGAGHRSTLMLDLCLKAGASVYLSGVGAKAYLQEADFIASGVRVACQDFRHPTYRQAFEPFMEGCFALDLLLNEPEQGRSIFLELVPAERRPRAMVR